MLGSRRSVGERLRALEADRKPRLNFTDEVMACISDDGAEWLLEFGLNSRAKRIGVARLAPADVERADAILKNAFTAAGVQIWL